MILYIYGKRSENLVEISLVCEGVGLSCRLHIHVMISFEHVESGKKMLALTWSVGRLRAICALQSVCLGIIL